MANLEKYRQVVRSADRVEALQGIDAPTAQRLLVGMTVALSSPVAQTAFNSFWQQVGAELISNAFRQWIAAQIAEHEARIPVLEAEITEAAVAEAMKVQ